MAKKLTRAEETTSTTSTGDVTLAGATSRGRSFSDAGAVNGDVIEAVIQDDNGNWEFDHYPYSAGVLTRSGSPIASSNAGARINLSGSSKVFSDLFAENILGNTTLSPSQLSANTNDWDPADATSGSKLGTVIRFSTDASRNITGFKAYPNNIRILINVGSNDAIFQDEGSSTASTAANRFAFGADIKVRAKKSLVIIYDGTTSRWRAIGGSALAPVVGVDTLAYDAQLFSNIPTINGTSNQSKTFALTDAGKMHKKAFGDTANSTYTIPAESSVNFPDGSWFMVYNDCPNFNLLIAINNSTDFLRWYKSSSDPKHVAATFTIAPGGKATIMKLFPGGGGGGHWTISGEGISA